ncbi:MAG: hypothetical protein AUJ41_04570 [Candidatus Pacebacteria bacterium CG1_02_43_31]|nr:MAG: hypothetical protein AUJ41_04570 [Candidatus Pacebacteria bacterium CG1_02_43_31]
MIIRPDEENGLFDDDMLPDQPEPDLPVQPELDQPLQPNEPEPTESELKAEALKNWTNHFKESRRLLVQRIMDLDDLDDVAQLLADINELGEDLDNHIIDNLNSGLDAFIKLVDQLRSSLEKAREGLEKQKKDQDLIDWKFRTNRLRNAVRAILSVDTRNIAPLSTVPGALTEADLTLLRETLITSQTAAIGAGYLEVASYSTNSEILRLIEELVGKDGLSGSVAQAREQIESLISKSQEKLPPKNIADMTYAEFMDEMLEKKLDPVRNEFGQTLTPGRERDLIIAFNKTKKPRGEGPDGIEYTPEQVLENITKRYELMLAMIDAKLYAGAGDASTDRSKLFEMLKLYMFSRKDMLIATTYHPEWGELTRTILREIIEGAAIEKPKEPMEPVEPSEPIRLNETDEEWEHVELEYRIAQDIYEDAVIEYPINVTRYPGVLRRFNEYCARMRYTPEQIEVVKKLASYNSLAGEQGRDNMETIVDALHPSLPAGVTDAEKKAARKVEMAKLFSQRLFTVFDMLNIIFQEDQLTTKTRAHNNGVEMTDVISLQNPLAAYEHAFERYSNPKDWRAWFMLYLETIPASQDSRFGAHHNSHKLHHMQKKLILHQEAYFDTDTFVAKIPIPDFCKSLFPDTYDLCVLNEQEGLKESLELPDGTVVDKSGRRTGNGERIIVFDLYPTSARGWEELLKFTFQSIPAEITEDHIITEAKPGEKYGLLGLWLAKAGEMKVFPGPINELIPPMLTHYILRLFQHFGGDNSARLILLAKVEEQLRDTKDRGGLDLYQAALNQVRENIHPRSTPRGKLPQNLVKAKNYRGKQRKKYVDFDWIEEHPGIDGKPPKQPPFSLPGITAVAANINPLQDPEREEYFARVNATDGGSLPLPAHRNGSMIQADEKK